MAFDPNIPEEQLKNEVAETVFFAYDCTRIIGNIDFAVYPHADKGIAQEALAPHVWAEAKRGKGDLDEALVQLLLTIGKARTFDRHNPPKFLAAFNAEGIVLIEYSAVHQVFYQNDFNWNVAPNDHGTREFRQLAELVGETLGNNALRFGWHDGESGAICRGEVGEKAGLCGEPRRDGIGCIHQNRRGSPHPSREPHHAPTLPPLTPPRVSPSLKHFISLNFNAAQTTALLQIDRNNFISVYNRWLEAVKPSIAVDWERLRKAGIIDGDFYLADIMSQENQTITEKLYVLLQNDRYVLNRQVDDSGLYNSSSAIFNDGQKAHNDFWRTYQRPPESVYWDYILDRRDLLVPQDIRERKGSFFTPRQWVELSQQYLADYLGKDWQDEYYVWDCAAGTGNLLAGLTNPSRVWASTIDQQDVDVMHQRIEKGANLYHNHVFQFDFLNDSFDKLPEELREIVEDAEKRKKLVVYINPPYAEATNARTHAGTGHNKPGVAKDHRISLQYREELGRACNEVFALFLMRVYKEIPGCILGEFSTLKLLQGANFTTFRHSFNAKLERLFVVPADTFDNVKGRFPIGFFIWDTKLEGAFRSVEACVHDLSGRIGTRRYHLFNGTRRINQWIKTFDDKSLPAPIGYMENPTPDVQNTNYLNIQVHEGNRHNNYLYIGQGNLIPAVVYFASRLSICPSWLNDRDQFLWPNDEWMADSEFQSDCLAYALLHGQNRTRAAEGVNHWIPFREKAVGLKNAYRSHFMVEFIEGLLAGNAGDGAGRSGSQRAVGQTSRDSSLAPSLHPSKVRHFPTGGTPIAFSKEAQALMDAGLALFRYYHRQPEAKPNASYYDIRLFFQGVNDRGRMNARSEDAEYSRLNAAVREALGRLGDTKIAPKVYAYGFLMG